MPGSNSRPGSWSAALVGGIFSRVASWLHSLPCFHLFDHSSSMKASVTSVKDFQVTQAVFFPLPANADTVSHPERLGESDTELIQCGNHFMYGYVPKT